MPKHPKDYWKLWQTKLAFLVALITIGTQVPRIYPVLAIAGTTQVHQLQQRTDSLAQQNQDAFKLLQQQAEMNKLFLQFILSSKGMDSVMIQHFVDSLNKPFDSLGADTVHH
jgi:hypothetical protein